MAIGWSPTPGRPGLERHGGRGDRQSGDIADPEVAKRIGCPLAIQSNFVAASDTLVNNAGIFVSKPFIEYTAEDFATVMSINLGGLLPRARSRAAAAACSSQSAASIVNRHHAALVDQPDRRHAGPALASLTAAGLDAVTSWLAIEYADKGIRVNAVCRASSRAIRN